MKVSNPTISDIQRDLTKELHLRLVAGTEGLKREIIRKNVHRPGLALSGFLEGFPFERVQVVGDEEMMYLRSLDKKQRTEKLNKLFSYNIPCVIAATGFRILPELREISIQCSIPLFVTKRAASEVTFIISNYLEDRFAPEENLHGTLVDVYGTGLLFIGRAGIGKSEIAVDLVERGHRLVADDVVIIKRKAAGVLMGSGPEMLKHLIEIRGVGVLNVRQMFGVRAIRLQKRVETIVELKDWKEDEDYERLGLNEKFTEYLGVKIPLIKLPIYPGKNITVIAEAIALNQHLKVYGINAAKDLHKMLLAKLKNKRRVSNYLKWDDE